MAGDDRASTRVTVDVELTPGGISGTVIDGRGEALPFHGWLELSALLDRVTPHAPPTPESESGL